MANPSRRLSLVETGNLSSRHGKPDSSTNWQEVGEEDKEDMKEVNEKERRELDVSGDRQQRSINSY